MSDPGVTRAESCVIACAEVWRGAGEVMVSPFGTIPALGARLAKLTFSPDISLTDGEAALMVGAPPIATCLSELVREAKMPYRSVFYVVWSGRRNMMTMATRSTAPATEHLAIGPDAKPKVRHVGVRGAPGNSVNHPSATGPDQTVRTFVEQVDVASGVGYAGRRRPAPRHASTTSRALSRTSAVRLQDAEPTMRPCSGHPGDTVDEIVAATGFALTVPGDAAETRRPTPEEPDLVRCVLHPGSPRDLKGRS